MTERALLAGQQRPSFCRMPLRRNHMPCDSRLQREPKFDVHLL